MMRRRRTIFLSFVSVAIVAGIAAFAVVRGRTSPRGEVGTTYVKAGEGVSRLRPLPSSAFVGYDLLEKERLATTIRQASIQTTGVSVSSDEAKQLAELAAAHLHAFSAGTREDLARLREAQGLESASLRTPDPISWEEHTKTLRDAEIDYANVRVIGHTAKGRGLLPDEPLNGHGERTVGLGKPRGPNDVHDPRRALTDVVAVELPGKLTDDVSSVRFKGRLRVLMTRRQLDGMWIVVGMQLRYPADAESILPPI